MLPFDYIISEKPKLFWTSKGDFWRYEPDFIISVFNQFMFFGVIVAFFFWQNGFLSYELH